MIDAKFIKHTSLYKPAVTVPAIDVRWASLRRHVLIYHDHSRTSPQSHQELLDRSLSPVQLVLSLLDQAEYCVSWEASFDRRPIMQDLLIEECLIGELVSKVCDSVSQLQYD